MKLSPLKGSACACALALLSACQPDPATKPMDRGAVTLQNGALLYPADHPQLQLLQTAEVQEAGAWRSEWPARLVWNEDRTQRIYSAFPGRVVAVRGDVGQNVTSGSVLAELASPEFGQAQAEHVRAQAELDLASQQLQRQEELFGLGITARKELETAQADHRRTRAEALRAQSRVQLYGGEASTQQALSLRSTLSGVVVERRINPGQELPAGGEAALFVITQPQHLWAWVDVPEKEQSGLQKGQTLELRVASLPGQSFSGRVQALADFIDPETRTLRVRLEVPNPQRVLKADMLATALIHRPLGEGHWVPASAIYLESGQHWCFVQQENGSFIPLQVSAQAIDNDRVWVRQGLRTGQRVVTRQTLLLAREYKLAMEASRQGMPSPPRANP